MNAAIDHLLAAARARGLTMDLLGFARKATAISFQQRKLDQFSISETCQLGVRVLDGRHEGVAYTESLDPASLELMLDEAQANARMIRRDWEAELPANLSSSPGTAADEPPIEAKIEAARRLEAAALDFDGRISAPGCRYADSFTRVWVANTRGLRGDYAVNSVNAYARCLAQDPSGPVMADEMAAERSFSRLKPAEVGHKAAERTLRRIGATRPTTGRYTAVLENRFAEDLVGFVSSYFSAKEVNDRISPLTGKLGRKVFAPCLTLTDDPWREDGAGFRPFDAEGFASKRTGLIEGGEVKAFLTNSVLARKLNLPHTASASRSPSTDLDVHCSNLVVTPGRNTQAELLAADKTVILITELMGAAGFRHASGDFSLPVEGFLYENGACVAPLKDFLISGNVLQLLAAVEAVGQDALAPVGNVICPSLLVRELNVSGRS